jgi:hypothetical protein
MMMIDQFMVPYFKTTHVQFPMALKLGGIWAVVCG